VITNIDFMQAVLAHEDFAAGKVTTRWVEKTLESNSLLFELQEQVPALHSLIAAALADVVFAGSKSQPAVSNETDPFSPWKQMNNYRI
jgi:pyruvate carboxylase